MATLDADLLDLTDPALYAQGVPHELFTELRRQSPIHRHRQTSWPGGYEEMPFWVVLGHPEIQRINQDWKAFTAFDGPGLLPMPQERRGNMIVAMDPPTHSRLRKLISSGFTPRMIRRLEEHIVRRTGEILDEVAERGECDFVADVAYQLPMHVIADIVGIPDADRPWVFQQTDRMLRALDPASPYEVSDGDDARLELFQYAYKLSQEKRAHPADDVWTQLATAQVPDEDGTMTQLEGLELETFFMILAIAGSETTRNSISQGLLTLLKQPESMAALRADPGLLDTGVDEILRWSSPVLYFGRTATEDVEIAGAQIRAGDRVTMWFPSGNRDERVFEDPFRFDLQRSPNPHVSFGGGGVHYCLGASLAKTEVRVMLEAVLSRFSRIELLAEPTWGGGGIVVNVGVSIDRLPVLLQPA